MTELSEARRPTSDIPGPKLSLWKAVREHIRFDRDPLGFMQSIRRTYGNLIRFNSHGRNLVFAFGPEHNRQIHAETDVFHSRPIVLHGLRGRSAQHRLRQSIFNLNEQEHHDMRHQLLPPFQRSVLANYHDTVVDLVDKSMRSWRPGQVRNLQQDMHSLVWSVVRKLLYGLDEDEASNSLYEAMEHWMFRTFAPGVRWFPVNLPFTPYRRMLNEAESLEERFLSLMQARRQQGIDGPDALSALLRMRRVDGTPMPDRELVGHALTLFLVAYETTGNTLTWTMFLLAQHPQMLHQVLDELAPWRGNAPAVEELGRLPLLERVFKESMRLLPAVPYNRRVVARDAALGPYFLPRRSRVIISHYVTHHSAELYPQPERFLPERWETIKPATGEYLPFGMGLKTCLGAALSQFVMKIALCKILPAWRMTIVPGTQIDRHLGISLGPRHGIPVTLARQDRRLEASAVCGNIHEMVELGREVAPVRRRAAA